MKAATYEKKIIKNMIAVGTYREEFREIVKTLSKIYEDLDKAKEQFEKTGGNYIVRHVNKTGGNNIVKNPLYKIIEEMEEKILAYNREIGLTPRGLKQIKNRGLDEKKKSKFEEALGKL